mmetsp:Transcript_5823/g.12255  ORF Transcript_5823/g.12255 Transcript_5823/m.12255 type:complete len:97 (+) Transcript_5823:127-417(+)
MYAAAANSLAGPFDMILSPLSLPLLPRHSRGCDIRSRGRPIVHRRTYRTNLNDAIGNAAATGPMSYPAATAATTNTNSSTTQTTSPVALRAVSGIT